MSKTVLEKIRAVLNLDGAWQEEWSRERHGPGSRAQHEQLKQIDTILNEAQRSHLKALR